LQLSRGTGKPRPPADLSGPVDPSVADPTAPTQPTLPSQLGPTASPRAPLVARAARFASLAIRAVRRYASEIRAVCANERTYGSVRGAVGDHCPYRDRSPEGTSCKLNSTHPVHAENRRVLPMVKPPA